MSVILPDGPSSYPRWDVVCRIDGGIVIIPGIEAPSPVAPSVPEGGEEVLRVWRTPSMRPIPVLRFSFPEEASTHVRPGEVFTGHALRGRVVVDMSAAEMTGDWLRNTLVPRLMPGATVEFRTTPTTDPRDVRIAELEAQVAHLRAGGSVAPE